MYLAERVQKFNKFVVPEIQYAAFTSPLRCSRHHMVVTLVVNSAKAHVRVEISDHEGGIRATSVLCLLGLGLGLGSLLIYRLCTRLFNRASAPPPSSNLKEHQKALRNHKLPIKKDDDDHNHVKHNTNSSSTKHSPQTPSDSGISTSSSNCAMGNVSSSPDSSSQAVFYQRGVEAIRFRGASSSRGESCHDLEDCDGFVHLNLHDRDDYKDADRESGVSLLSTSPESEEVQRLTAFSRSSRPHRYRQLTIDIPYSKQKESGEAISSFEESDPGIGFSPSDSFDLQFTGDNISIGGQSLLPNFSPMSLHEKNTKLSGDDSLHGGKKSHEGSLRSSQRKHSTPLSEQSKSPMTAIESRIFDYPNADEHLSHFTSSHSSYSIGADSLDQSSLTSSRCQSADLFDSLSGCLTPDNELFHPDDVGQQTQEGLNILETDIQDVQREIHDMSIKIKRLCCKERFSIPSAVAVPDLQRAAAKSPEVQKVLHVIKRHRSSSSSSCGQSIDNTSTPERGSPGKSFTHKAEYMWDFRSDLAASAGGRTGDGAGASSASAAGSADLYEHFSRNDKKYWSYLGDSSESSTPSVFSPKNSSPAHSDFRTKMHHLPSHSVSTNSFDLTPDNSRQDSVSVNDLYIDDSYSGLGSRIGSKLSFLSDTTDGYSLSTDLKTTYDTASSNASDPASVSSSVFSSPVHIVKDTISEQTDTTAENMAELSASRLSPTADQPKLTMSPINNKVHNGNVPVKTDATSDQASSEAADLDVETVIVASPKTNILNIGPKVSLKKYSDQEWRGDTKMAKTMKQGYASIPERLGCKFIRRIRGDNYCAIRAALYQCLVNGIDIVSHVNKILQLPKDLSTFDSISYGYLQKWSFAGRIKVSSSQIQPILNQCIQCLFRQVKGVVDLRGTSAKEELIAALLNNQQGVNIQLMEAVKALMMLTAIRLYEDYTANRPVPTFVWLMYARDTSMDPKTFFQNHLDKVGDAAGLEQVEMYLLAYTLGINIEVVRPSKAYEDDFITNYQEDSSQDVKLKVQLIAEDDRHYNVLM